MSLRVSTKYLSNTACTEIRVSDGPSYVLGRIYDEEIAGVAKLDKILDMTLRDMCNTWNTRHPGHLTYIILKDGRAVFTLIDQAELRVRGPYT